MRGKCLRQIKETFIKTLSIWRQMLPKNTASANTYMEANLNRPK